MKVGIEHIDKKSSTLSTSHIIVRSILYGTLGTIALLTVYFSILGLISGISPTISQFSQYWYYLIGLAVGFGIQVGLYIYLIRIIQTKHGSRKILVTSGTTSTAAMLSCCAHYLVTILPILGITGIASFASMYQIQLFWIGLLFNVAGIAYISRKITHA